MQEKKRDICRGILCLALLFALVFAALSFSACARGRDTFTVRVLDVGQGDAILLSRGKHFMLIDAADAAEHDHLFGQLASAGVKRLDRFLITHPHSDHCGCARAVIERYKPDVLSISPVSSEDTVYKETLAAAEDAGTVCEILKTADTFDFCGVAFEVLHTGGEDGVNNACIVLRAVWGDTVWLFMGDAEFEAEKELLSLYPAEYLDCDFLKIGHHGSASSTRAEFVAATTPAYAAISCGKENSYGFPAAEVLENLAAVSAEVGRTDLEGCLVYTSDGKSVERQQSERVRYFWKKEESADAN